MAFTSFTLALYSDPTTSPLRSGVAFTSFTLALYSDPTTSTTSFSDPTTFEKKRNK
ncbi:MAG: hypothetical protein ACI96M_003548 [Candidatus Azotimanducaceae bacterium]